MTTTGAPPLRQLEIDLEPVTARIGARVSGVDLTARLDAPTITALRQALSQWKVLFFGGHDLTHTQYVEFAHQWGPLVYPNSYDERQPPPGYPEEHLEIWREFPELTRVEHRLYETRRANYSTSSGAAHHTGGTFRDAHIDSSPLVNPPEITFLRAERVPHFGGDTTWFDAVAAYEGLSEPVRRLADTLWAQHELVRLPYNRWDAPTTWATHHPVVRVIPETGQRALFLSPSRITHVIGVSADESAWILGHLFAELARPAYAVRFKWAPGDLAVSDNRTTVHLGPVDLSPDTDRLLHLLLVDGDLPVATDGRRSIAVSGEPVRRSARSIVTLDAQESERTKEVSCRY